jgi:hypothetical protein
MTISTNSVKKGKCYRTAADPPQVRRVLDVDAGSVTYEARGHKLVQGNWGRKITASMDTFLAAIVAEVPCDFDPDFGSKKSN